ncbi:MAG: type II toxin-antitoxin system HicA family toxin [Dehalococcoidales bacterium]|nr:type II toxin-antitoxin system HicA family toxin [Dehalococcoidales bacterium]
MSNFDKLIKKFLAKPPEVLFTDVMKVLEAFNYSERHSGTGSHRVFIKPGNSPIIVPVIKGRKVKRAYIQMIIDRLELEDYRESEDR